jgi:DNA-binding PadR family transcriptional regulator
MDRDIDRDSRERAAPERPRHHQQQDERLSLSREHALYALRGCSYRLSAAELETMYDIGRFRTIALEDLARHRYQGDASQMRQDLRLLNAQGLVQSRTVSVGGRRQSLPLVVLTKVGKEVLEQHRRPRDEQDRTSEKQSVYSGLVKRNELRHDAAVYRMFQAERQKIEAAGGRVRRVILDYELKRRVYAPLAKARALPRPAYAKRQLEIARLNGLTVVKGKIPLPDLRLEYETRSGELASVDLELATGHYHGSALQAKAEAGFKFYVADGSHARLSRVLEERDITVAILTL